MPPQAVVADIDPLPALIDLEQSLASDTHIYEAANGNARVRLGVHGRHAQHRTGPRGL